MIQKTYRSYKERKRFIELREKAMGIFRGKKERRRVSIERPFQGDYFKLDNPTGKDAAQRRQLAQNVQKIMQKYNEKRILFFDKIQKLNNKFKVQERALLITEAAIYTLEPKKMAMKRRIPIADIEAISLSPFFDCYMVLHYPQRYDYFFETEHKTEAVSNLLDAYKNLNIQGKPDLPLRFDEKVPYKVTQKDTRIVSFVKDDANASAFKGAPPSKTSIIKPAGKNCTILLKLQPVAVGLKK